MDTSSAPQNHQQAQDLGAFSPGQPCGWIHSPRTAREESWAEQPLPAFQVTPRGSSPSLGGGASPDAEQRPAAKFAEKNVTAGT